MKSVCETFNTYNVLWIACFRLIKALFATHVTLLVKWVYFTSFTRKNIAKLT